jgi:cytoskeletal protein CcmA (bactofilin family)
MWSKQQTVAEPASSSPAQGPAAPIAPGSSSSSSPSNARLGGAPLRNPARLGSTLQIKGEISGAEALLIDGKVEGPISLHGHELTVGPNAQLTSGIEAGDVIVYGKVVGDVHARGRVDIKADGSIIGDISSARISIEDGAHFKGRIEIDPAKQSQAASAAS